ncbi:MAG: YceI family protein [Ahniella sp.]|nr:YceI family protein [Ahniella sp.]
MVVPVGQLQMKSQSRRDWALGDEFFDAARHPKIRFSASLKMDQMLKALADGKVFDIDGQLSLRGETHGQRFQVTQSTCEFTSKSACDIELSADISRKRFGMAAHSFALADNVSMKIQLHLVMLAP